ncbi:putative CoA-transferase family III protein [Actinoplanes missouriensis 431]|uniref:Putative CoA-transferase family III protein n=1 Tax=Actinoplanes missouriensis (strain ATCC 14538 / DSM 43046 / CBS 188.64 / JCM 3121 / NBRC 102363 / NCIMB 12654 / NRRL B-3342 / UNCC 431) TaxID=512565 RepID=I0HD75_ACTM4|nr:CoA transferase [Actinoplanes missouriensis]BAL90962.1 putative CoA-transferase family III protein [Actinoplanes missouriensis 431]
MPAADSPLSGVRVVDASTLFAGPLAATILGDYGADVLKIEHPVTGDPARGHGPAKDGVPLWWTMLGRNKRTLTLSLSTTKGAEILKSLVEETDVLIENFRPGTLERWGLAPQALQEINPKLIIARVTTYGQSGPYSHRPGFGTLAEAMSGFAAITGDPGGPPTLPPFGLADGIAALTGAQAIMTALYHRDVHDQPGQVIDLAIVEPMLTVLGMQAMVYDQLGVVQQRTGNRSVNNAPRNTYRTADGRWVAVSTSAQPIAERVMRLIGRPELIDEPWFATGVGRAAHADLLDEAMAAWIGARSQREVQDAFDQAQAAIAPVYDIADVFADPQFQARDAVTTAHDPTLGPVRMPGPLYRMSRTPGRIRWTGRPRGADTDDVLAGLGYDEERRAELRAEGVI